MLSSVEVTSRVGYAQVIGSAAQGAANAGWFGDGRDGDIVVADGETLTLDVAADEGQVIFRPRSLWVKAGGKLTVSNRCCGLIILCAGDLTIDGTIDMDCKAPLISALEDTNAAEPHVRLCGLTGGRGGDGGRGNTGDGTYWTSYTLSSLTSGGIGGDGFCFGGGFPGGGGASGARRSQTGDDRQGEYLYPTGNGADGTRAPIGTPIPYSNPSYAIDVGDYGVGGNTSYSTAVGGAGYGGSGAGLVFFVQSNGYFSSSTPYNGKTGGAVGGGAVYIFAGGRVIITGTITACGGNGADCVAMNSIYASGGGGGAGGGIIVVVHAGDYTNTGSLIANGGNGGKLPSTITNTNYCQSAPGQDGEIGTVLITTLADLLAK